MGRVKLGTILASPQRGELRLYAKSVPHSPNDARCKIHANRRIMQESCQLARGGGVCKERANMGPSDGVPSPITNSGGPKRGGSHLANARPNFQTRAFRSRYCSRIVNAGGKRTQAGGWGRLTSSPRGLGLSLYNAQRSVQCVRTKRALTSIAGFGAVPPRVANGMRPSRAAVEAKNLHLVRHMVCPFAYVDVRVMRALPLIRIVAGDSAKPTFTPISLNHFSSPSVPAP